MEFRKVTISLPDGMYNEGQMLIKKGLFSNFSDLVRSGVRTELKELQQVAKDFDETSLYKDKELLKGLAESVIEARAGKGKIFKSDKEMDAYFEAI